MSAKNDILRDLVRELVGVLGRLGMSSKDILQSKVEDLPFVWQVPPIRGEYPIGLTDLCSILNRSARVSVDGLYNLWQEGLDGLLNAPHVVVMSGRFRKGSSALPTLSPGERNLRLPVPEGFPLDMSGFAGHMFSLDCANLLRHSYETSRFVDDEDNYFAELHDGRIIGVQDGFPAGPSLWDTPATGRVDSMLRSGRGVTFEGSEYGLLSRLRCLLWQNKEKIKDFEAFDWVLQALRVLYDGESPRAVLRAIENLKSDSLAWEARVSALQECVDMLSLLALSDRAKILSMHGLLVPLVCSPSEFSANIYQGPPPAMVSEKVRDKISRFLETKLMVEQSRYAVKE